MQNFREQLQELFNKPEWTSEEYAVFLDLIEKHSPSELQSFFLDNYIDHLPQINPANPEQASQLLRQIHERLGMKQTQAQVIRMHKKRYWPRIAAAASIILLLGTGSYFLFFNKTNNQQQPVTGNGQPAHDVKAPETNRAMITLANGQKVFLDSATTGQLAMQTNIRISKTGDGKVIYESTDDNQSSEIQYNTLSNPRGSKVIDMTLTDGSHVWLNAGSSVTFPVTFAGNERKVSITGEAYFEVTHDASRPFRVFMAPSPSERAGGEVEVLGTHFNVNAYDDEPTLKITLLKGSVKVTKANSEQGTANSQVVLRPGEQAVITDHSPFTTHRNVDIDAVVAWKNGYFSFKNADLRTMMRQAARWYDVELDFEGAIPDVQFSGEIGRDLTLSQFLRILDKTRIAYKIEGKKLIITP